MSEAKDNIQHNTQPIIPGQFADIAPYTDLEFRSKMSELVNEDGFEHAVRYVMPDVDYPEFIKQLLELKSQDQFQRQVMGDFLELLAKTTTDGISIDGLDKCKAGESYTFITTHRDIGLDASFLNLCFIRNNMPLTQVAIGNNLLIYEWISDLVKLNRSFIVKRDVQRLQALDAARQLSAYIHYTINTLKESVWIAQREGRAKDSNDVTQESLVKMLSLDGGGSIKENILAVNLMPVSISYEFDPNDYLKAREFLLKRRDPDFKKSKRDDLFSMETGLLRHKGRIHFRIGNCINDELRKYEGGEDRAHVVHETCRLIDRTIHCGYNIFPCNYIAYDEVSGSARFSDRYTAADVERFDEYINKQLDKVDVDNVTSEEREYMRHMMLSMYANPLRNQLAAMEAGDMPL